MIVERAGTTCHRLPVVNLLSFSGNQNNDILINRGIVINDPKLKKTIDKCKHL